MIDPNKRKKPNSLALLAGRIANLAIPSSANSIFGKIQQSHARRFGGPGQAMGIASDPRQWFMQANQFTDKIGIGLGGTMSLKDAQSKIELETRTQLANRTGATLPQFLSPLKNGIASAVNLQTGEVMEQRTTGANSMYVEDKRWPVTLAQILGSKMLTPDQLKRASIQNVSTMFNVQGGTQTEKAEMYYMFQRFMLEGFIRGVDVTKDFKGQGGKNPRFTIHLDNGSTVKGNENNIGVSKQGEVRFNVDYMRRNDDNVKMSLFYHEMGHELLNREHAASASIMKSGGSNAAGNKLDNSVTDYNQLMGDLYGPNGGRLSGGYNHLKIPVQRNQQAAYDPSWFPSASGQQDGYTPDGQGGAGAAIPGGGGYSSQTTLNQTTINPFQVNAETGQGGGAASVQLSQPDTLDVPGINLPNQGVSVNQGFAAGVSSVGQQQGASLQGMAGALNNLKAG